LEAIDLKFTTLKNYRFSIRESEIADLGARDMPGRKKDI